ncbi:hypothetical protein MBLNU13_g09883t1 [Cladosporium sp. NU13]
MENDPGRQLVRGHTYSNIISQGQAQVHIGDKHNYGDASTHNHTYYLCASSSEQSSQLLALCGHGGIATNEGELLSLKRRRSPNEKEHKHKLDKEESLEHALSKLGKFSKSVQDQRIGKDAKKIVRRIALAIDAVKTQQAGLPGHPNAEPFTRMEHDRSDFKNIKKNLKITGRVDVNTGFRRRQSTKLTRAIRKYDKIAFEQWVISLKTLTIESRNSDGTAVIYSLVTLYLEPRVSGSGLPVTVYFGETRTHKGVNFINPVILAYRIVPNESEVFEAIEKDDLKGLITLLAAGKATVRDCDEDGTTLLHVNSFDAFNFHGNITRCGKILLKSGADPTLTDGKTDPPVVTAMMSSPTISTLILVEGNIFLDPKNFRHNRMSLWLNACRNSYSSAPWILQILKDAGCNIAEKDHRGWNCLFITVLSSIQPGYSHEFEKLQYLLGIFDNIHARDTNGRTIFDYVDDVQEDDYCGSYSRDLWYCALKRAGIDVSSHLAQHPRVPSYKMRGHFEYTPEHYHALKHLQSWDEDNFRSQMDRLLQEIPLDEDEALEMERMRREEASWKPGWQEIEIP